jgi:hypothetical protein
LPVGGVHDPGIPRPGAGSRYPDVPPALPRTYRWRRCRTGAFSTIVGPVAEKEAAMEQSPSLGENGVDPHTTRPVGSGRVGRSRCPVWLGAAVGRTPREWGASVRHEAGTGRAVDDLSGADGNGWTTRAVR